MNFSQKLGLFILIVISVAYVYFSFFTAEGFHLPLVKDNSLPPIEDITEPTVGDENPEQVTETSKKHSYKTIKIYVTDSNGNLHSLNRECDTTVEKSCFAYAIKELISAPSKWEKSKGYTSEIPQGTKILSVREGEGSVMIDLSSRQLIKTAKANTNLPVYLYINGRQADVIGGDGIMIKQPLTERSLDE